MTISEVHVAQLYTCVANDYMSESIGSATFLLNFLPPGIQMYIAFRSMWLKRFW